jgi:CheY-like chemotaxis protein
LSALCVTIGDAIPICCVIRCGATVAHDACTIEPLQAMRTLWGVNATREGDCHYFVAPADMSNAARILVVEDDAATRLGLQELLRDAGYDAIVAATFKEGRQALEQQSPDLLITDLRLDGFNGLQLLHMDPRTIPAIIVTGFHDSVLQAEARRLGAEYLVKPFPMSTIIDMVHRLLGQGASREERRRWSRRRVTRDLPAESNGLPARLLDASHGGVRLEVSGTPQKQSEQIRLVFPFAAMAVDVEVLWCLPERIGSRWTCGGTVDALRHPEWPAFVDANL